MLSEDKEREAIKSECQEVSCPFGIDSPQLVNIRQNSTDGWGIEKMQIQKYPGSLEFVTYSLDGKDTKFWVEGDTSVGNLKLNNCEDGKWCPLKTVDVAGNPFHIILRSC